uniref:uncharacterized protein LOC122589931 n=1 Tax=Erigeron canadensis TaxID=72917 RepID=UPI001CB94BF6|nr:uncharacterized protein LOC122589931 [Erigeron canadensis]
MGCCISKCQPNPTPKLPHSNNIIPSVQDKLVIISQSPPSTPPSPPRKRKTIQSPPSSITSASLTCSTQTNTCCSSTLSSASSTSSSVALFSKVADRSFSNDFLHSCAMENPQIVGLDHHVKKSGEVKKLSPGTTQKRPRASSPTITRQKSFRVEKEKPLNTSIVNGRNFTMRSPSPSRRFNTYNNTSSYQRQQPMLVSRNTYNESNRIVKANSRPASPYRNVINNKEYSRPVYMKNNNKDRFGYEVGSKVEGVGVGQVLSKVDYSEAVPMEEDLDNPHIALDCFIFL